MLWVGPAYAWQQHGSSCSTFSPDSLFTVQGVRGDHVEFRHLDGSPGSRVNAAWGFNGLVSDEMRKVGWVSARIGAIMLYAGSLHSGLRCRFESCAMTNGWKLGACFLLLACWVM